MGNLLLGTTPTAEAGVVNPSPTNGVTEEPKTSPKRSHQCYCHIFPGAHDLARHIDPREGNGQVDDSEELIDSDEDSVEEEQQSVREDDEIYWWEADCNCSLSLTEPHHALEHCTKCGRTGWCRCKGPQPIFDASTVRQKDAKAKDEWGTFCRCCASADGYYASHYTSEHCSICGGLEQVAGMLGICYECMLNQTTLADH